MHFVLDLLREINILNGNRLNGSVPLFPYHSVSLSPLAAFSFPLSPSFSHSHSLSISFSLSPFLSVSLSPSPSESPFKSQFIFRCLLLGIDRIMLSPSLGSLLSMHSSLLVALLPRLHCHFKFGFLCAFHAAFDFRLSSNRLR